MAMNKIAYIIYPIIYDTPIFQLQIVLILIAKCATQRTKQYKNFSKNSNTFSHLMS